MTDRFDAELRQHLLTTANERPATGQLAAVISDVATTRQRPSFAARLALNPGRMWRFPSAPIRYGLVAAALVVTAVGGAIIGGGAASGPSTVFDGTWTATDPADGSGLTLAVGSGTEPDVYFEDGYASGEGCVNDEVKRFRARGTGTVTGTRLETTFPNGGGCGLALVGVPQGTYDYIAANDTMIDQDGVIWSRALSEAPPTRGPVTEPTLVTEPTPEPTQAGNCRQFDAPGTYAAVAAEVTDGVRHPSQIRLSVQVPATAEQAWSGLREGFTLLRAACKFGAPVSLEASVLHHVFPDACDRIGSGVAVDTPATAIEVLRGDTPGVSHVRETDVTIDGYAGVRFDYAVRPELVTDACTGGVIELVEGVSNVDPGMMPTVYVLDVDGAALAVSVYWGEDRPALEAEVDAMVSSMTITP